MRLSVVSRMFTYRPREISSVQTSFERVSASETDDETDPTELIGAADGVAEQIAAGSQPVVQVKPHKAVSDQRQSSDGKRKRKRKR